MVLKRYFTRVLKRNFQNCVLISPLKSHSLFTYLFINSISKQNSKNFGKKKIRKNSSFIEIWQCHKTLKHVDDVQNRIHHPYLSDFCTTIHFPIFNTFNQIIETREIFFFNLISRDQNGKFLISKITVNTWNGWNSNKGTLRVNKCASFHRSNYIN